MIGVKMDSCSRLLKIYALTQLGKFQVFIFCNFFHMFSIYVLNFDSTSLAEAPCDYAFKFTLALLRPIMCCCIDVK